MSVGSWLNLELSLATQAAMEIDRRKAAQLGPHERAAMLDRLICDWYSQRSVIEQALGRVGHLEVELALQQAPPFNPEPQPQHWRWARELLGGGG